MGWILIYHQGYRRHLNRETLLKAKGKKSEIKNAASRKGEIAQVYTHVQIRGTQITSQLKETAGLARGIHRRTFDMLLRKHPYNFSRIRQHMPHIPRCTNYKAEE
jgi:hypothetical protein